MLKKKVIISGDLNLKHTHWGCKYINLGARTTMRTRLDMVFVRNYLRHHVYTLERDLNPDHYPVTVALVGHPITKEPR